MIIATSVIIACVTTVASIAAEKALSQGWDFWKTKKRTPEDLERIARIQQIFSSIEKIAENDPSQKEIVRILKTSMIDDLEKEPNEELKEIERVISGILLSYRSNLTAA